MPTTSRPGPRGLAAIACALALAGCASSPSPSAPSATAPMTPTPLPSAAAPTPTPRPAAEVYGEIRAAVERIRGLQPTKPVEPVTIDEAQLRANLTAEIDREYPADRLRFENLLLSTLRLLPEGTNLRDVMLDFQAGQVAGYYSPDRDELFVVSRAGGVGAPEMVTYAHEFTHQLQDQRFGLEGLGLDARDQRDRSLARLSVIEGDAVSVQTTWMTGNLTPEQLGELLRSALDPKAMEALQRAPAYVRETALFPYEQGFAFVMQRMAGAGYSDVDAVYADPPASTEQLIHPEKYAAREAPVTVEIPDGLAAELGSGWSATGEDTLGEAVLGVWLRAGQVPRADAAAAVAGWGGDRLVLVTGPGGTAGVGIVTTWDSAADASEFAAAATTAMAALDSSGVVVADGLLRVLVAMGDGATDIAAALAR